MKHASRVIYLGVGHLLTRRALKLALVGALVVGLAGSFNQSSAPVPLSSFVNFEAAQTNPVRLSPDGTRLFAVNTADARVSVFDLSTPSAPKLIVEIPVGIEPVSVFPRNNEEAWVTNQESDSVSVISALKGIVTDTIYVKDEPSDVIVVGSRAFVSVSRSNQVAVFDATTHQLIKRISLLGNNPRALAASPNGKTVYTAFALSGNRTTIIPTQLAPPQPPPTNPQLPPPPQVALIVDATDPAWSSVIAYSMPDNDVAAIDTTSLTVSRYYSRVGTLNLGLAVLPTTGDVFVSNIDSRNLVFYEPVLRGHWVDNRLTRITLTSGQVTPFDLNPGIDYTVLPNPAALATALAQPTSIVPDPSGAFLYVAAFGTDRVAKVDTNGNVLGIIEIGPATGSTVDPKTKRGPRGLALNATAKVLYVLNRLSDTISVVSTANNTVLREVRVGYDPTPAQIKGGRGFLYDAKLSGNGTGSCGSCHLDGDQDHLAWNLGDPGGVVHVVVQNGNSYSMHPMKGPMVTQSLRGLAGTSPFHWRGDRADFTAFNPAFSSLMGGSQISTADMNLYAAYAQTLTYMPNPNQNLDRTLPATLNGGDPNAGRDTYINVPAVGSTTCNDCHTANPGPGTNRLITFQSHAPQPLKVPQLRNLYQKLLFRRVANQPTIDGFGFASPGEFDTMFSLLNQPGRFPNFQGNIPLLTDLIAFQLCFDTGMAPAVGYTRTATAANLQTSSLQSDWTLLEAQAVAGNIDVIIKGTLGGGVHGLVYQTATNDYKSDSTVLGTFTRAQLSAAITNGNTMSVMGVSVGSGIRMGIDRNLDGVLDGDVP